MAGIHIDDFYRDAAKTLISLFGVFPRPVTIFAEDICGSDDPDEFGLHSQRFQACFATLLWLGEEGYLRYQDTVRNEAIDQAVLSGRCFAALLQPVAIDADDQDNLPPSIRAEHATLVHQLEVALHSRSSTALAGAFQPLLERMSA